MTELVTCWERQTELQLEYVLSIPSPFTPIALSLFELGSCGLIRGGEHP